MAIYVRALKEEEKEMLEKISSSRKESADKIKRAKILLLSNEKLKVREISKEIGLHANIVRDRIHRCNDEGLETALADRPRSGRPETYDEEAKGTIIQTARTAPKELGVDMCHWTLLQLQYYLNEHKDISIGFRQIQRVLKAEQINWRKSRTWLHSSDPEFTEKRGTLSAPMATLTPSTVESVSIS